MASSDVVKDMFVNYYQHITGSEKLVNKIQESIHYKMSPADISELFDRCWKEPEKAVEYLNLIASNSSSVLP